MTARSLILMSRLRQLLKKGPQIIMTCFFRAILRRFHSGIDESPHAAMMGAWVLCVEAIATVPASTG